MTILKVTLFFMLSFASYGQAMKVQKKNVAAAKSDSLQPSLFKIIVCKEDFSMAYGLQYILTDKSLEIIFKAGLKDEKDTSLFNMNLKPQVALSELARVNIDSLKSQYSNPCVMDGSQILFYLAKNGKSKTVYLSNYYQADVGLAIQLINQLVPEKYKIWYDKVELLGMQANCK